MADHRAEQILQAVVANVTGLATTGNNVTRARATPQAAGALPALAVYQGPDVPLDADLQSVQYLDVEFTVYIDILVATATQQVDTLLNQIRVEIARALWADYQQGLSFVIEMREGSADEPMLVGEGELPAASMRTAWIFKYRRSRTDPSA